MFVFAMAQKQEKHFDLNVVPVPQQQDEKNKAASAKFEDVYKLAIISPLKWGDKNFTAYQDLLKDIRGKLPKGDERIKDINEKLDMIKRTGYVAESIGSEKFISYSTKIKQFSLELQPPMSMGYVKAVTVEFKFDEAGKNLKVLNP